MFLWSDVSVWADNDPFSYDNDDWFQMFFATTSKLPVHFCWLSLHLFHCNLLWFLNVERIPLSNCHCHWFSIGLNLCCICSRLLYCWKVHDFWLEPSFLIWVSTQWHKIPWKSCDFMMRLRYSRRLVANQRQYSSPIALWTVYHINRKQDVHFFWSFTPGLHFQRVLLRFHRSREHFPTGILVSQGGSWQRSVGLLSISPSAGSFP